MAIPVVSTKAPLDFTRGKLRAAWRDLPSPISCLSLERGLSAPRFALGVPHPFKAFDALFGLTAIALGQPGLSASIAAEVRLLHRLADAGGRLSSPHIRQTYADAIAVIEGTADWAGGDAEEIEALGWAPEAPTGLATEPALRTDPAIITPSGHLLAFVILPAAFATPVAQFNPARRLSRRSRPTTPSDVIAQVLRGAWGGPPPPANRVLH